MSAPICFLDTETDGVHPGRKPWEIAMIRREPDGTERTETFYVHIDLATADPFGLRVGRFYDRHPLGRRLALGPGAGGRAEPKNLTAAATLVAQLTHGAHIVGAVPNFDTEVLDRLLRDQGLLPAWRYRLVDVLNLTAGHLGRLVGGLTDCATALGIDVPAESEHTALGDTHTAMAVYDRVMQGASS